ncbi:hypothetical protein [Hymenobacter cellulosilyticus]|uniref:Uncharacterized protein n=1 Tax=Hymenobacter cellulosilyticus TaxID=2932248 RepID=A0A8T9Q0D9_9BACT|nr:hypothetical protein [Hymenobacter cellulosilyticus]UOQ70322.1 hypothetical protein MUN79_16395 [Hymenobacter cellulosilyticus]
MELVTVNTYSARLLQIVVVALVLLLVIIWQGHLRRRLPFLLLTLLSGAGLVLGLLFRIQHWAGSAAITVSSSLLLLATYGIWFSRKQPKTRFDFSKLAFVTGLGLWGLSSGSYSALLFPWLLSFVRLLLPLTFWLLLLDFAYLTYVGRRARR